MRTLQGSKILEVVPVPPSGYNVQYLKSILSQAKAYVRPIQKHLLLEPLSTEVVSSDVIFEILLVYLTVLVFLFHAS